LTDDRRAVLEATMAAEIARRRRAALAALLVILVSGCKDDGAAHQQQQLQLGLVSFRLSVVAPPGQCWAGSAGRFWYVKYERNPTPQPLSAFTHDAEGCGNSTVEVASRGRGSPFAFVRKKTPGRWALTAILERNGKELDRKTTRGSSGVVQVRGRRVVLPPLR
jgi:hypothetical protein